MGGSPSSGEFGLPCIATGMTRCSGTHTDSKPAASRSRAKSAQRRGPTIAVAPNEIICFLPYPRVPRNRGSRHRSTPTLRVPQYRAPVDVGFIGLGNMGSRIVEGLLDGGHRVHLWARRPASLEPFADRASSEPSPAAVGAASEVVGICVWDEHDVDSVLLGPDGVLAGAPPGTVVA